MQARIGDGFRQISDKVAGYWDCSGRFVRVRHIAGPQCISVVMFSGQHGIAGADVTEKSGPAFRIPIAYAFIEVSGKAVVIEVRAVCLDVVPVSGSVLQAQGVEIPLGVRV